MGNSDNGTVSVSVSVNESKGNTNDAPPNAVANAVLSAARATSPQGERRVD